MKITFLGTSHGLPEKERMCSCTMIEVGDVIYIVDMGAPFVDIAARREIKYEKIKAVFITHPHGDHHGGLPLFLGIEKWHHPDSATKCYIPDQMLMNALAPILAPNPDISNTKVETILFEEGLFYDDGVFKVEAIHNDHLKHAGYNSYGFKIECEGKKILFTGDLTAEMYDFPQVAFEEKFDLIVTECAHAQAQTLEKKLKKIKTDIAVINHIYPFEKMDYLGALDGKFGYKIIIGKDNDELIL